MKSRCKNTVCVSLHGCAVKGLGVCESCVYFSCVEHAISAAEQIGGLVDMSSFFVLCFIFRLSLFVPTKFCVCFIFDRFSCARVGSVLTLFLYIRCFLSKLFLSSAQFWSACRERGSCFAEHRVGICLRRILLDRLDRSDHE